MKNQNYRGKVFLFKKDKDLGSLFSYRLEDTVSSAFQRKLGPFRDLSGLHIEQNFDDIVVLLDHFEQDSQEKDNIYGFCGHINTAEELLSFQEKINSFLQKKRFSEIPELQLFFDKDGFFYLLFLANEQKTNDFVFSLSLVKKERDGKSKICDSDSICCTEDSSLELFRSEMVANCVCSIEANIYKISLEEK